MWKSNQIGLKIDPFDAVLKIHRIIQILVSDIVFVIMVAQSDVFGTDSLIQK